MEPNLERPIENGQRLTSGRPLKIHVPRLDRDSCRNRVVENQKKLFRAHLALGPDLRLGLLGGADQGGDGLAPAEALLGHARVRPFGADDGGFGDVGVGDQGGFDLGGGDAVAGDVHDVVDAAEQPQVAVGVVLGAVTGEVEAQVGEFRPVGVFVALLVAPDAAQHGGPGLVQHQQPAAAGFAQTKDLEVLEIGCGLGTDGAQFAEAGANYTGIDLTEAAVNLARRRFELFNLRGSFRVADAERLDYPDNSFDLVYSHGVLHHTPDIRAAVRELHRVLRPGGRAVVMVYHRDSYNYRINISVLRRAGVHLLRWNAGVKLVRALTGESEESLREHVQQLRANHDYLNSNEFLSRNTDGAGNPLAKVYSRQEARELFKDFDTVELRPYFLNKRWLPVVGPVLPRSLEAKLAARWGWHLWIYATKRATKGR